MSKRTTTKINHKTGNKVTTTVTRTGKDTHIKTVLHKADGILGSTILGTKKTLTDKTIRRR